MTSQALYQEIKILAVGKQRKILIRLLKPLAFLLFFVNFYCVKCLKMLGGSLFVKN